MFVSSYTTYIDTSSTNKAQKDRVDSTKKDSSSADFKLIKPTDQTVILGKKLPVNYISNYKALNNRQLLEQNDLTKSVSKEKFTKINSMNSAKIAYGENSKMFSLIMKPKVTIDSTPKVDKKLPVEAKVGQENIIKHQMVNTYIENDNYYKITA